MAGFRVDLGVEECRLVFVGGGLVGNFSVCTVEAVRTSKTEVAPVGFRSVLGCFFRQLSSLAGAEEGAGWLEGADSCRFLFLDFLVDGARRFQVMTTLTVVSWRSVWTVACWLTGSGLVEMVVCILPSQFF